MVTLSFGLLILATTTAGFEVMGNFFCDVNASDSSIPMSSDLATLLEGYSHYRLLPGQFPAGMHYHFDGLATVLKFSFTKGNVETMIRPYMDSALTKWSHVNFLGTGTGPTFHGLEPSLKNPAVNLLPINDQLWLTTDTRFWGQVDPVSLETLNNSAQVASTVLNAHPACDQSDRNNNQCFVQYPCQKQDLPLTNQVCFGLLQTTAKDLQTVEVSRASLPSNVLIQHSHEPCVTTNYVVSKVDHFGKRDNSVATAGLLKELHQVENNLWLVMDRRTNHTTVLTANTAFVNNHFTNCVERDGAIVTDVVATTGDYLDAYFEPVIHARRNWTRMFHRPQRCSIPITSSGLKNVTCKAMLPLSPNFIFDYPTFNPRFKMNPKSQFLYGISPNTFESQWFDTVVKIDVLAQKIVANWTAPGMTVTEAGFVQLPGKTGEDEGILLSIVYNVTDDSSSLLVLDAQSLHQIDMYPMGFKIPFHAHGITCDPTKACHSNP